MFNDLVLLRLDFDISFADLEWAAKVWPFAWTVRMRTHHTLALLNNVLDNSQSQANTLMIHLSRSVKFSKSWEQGAYFFFGHSSASIFDMENKTSCTGVVGYLDRDFTTCWGKFKGVFDQVDEHLFESALVTNDL